MQQKDVPPSLLIKQLLTLLRNHMLSLTGFSTEHPFHFEKVYIFVQKRQIKVL
jgi:hypothetical protein